MSEGQPAAPAIPPTDGTTIVCPTPEQESALRAAAIEMVSSARAGAKLYYQGLTYHRCDGGQVTLRCDNPGLITSNGDAATKHRAKHLHALQQSWAGVANVVYISIAEHNAPSADPLSVAAAKATRKTEALEEGRNLEHLPPFFNFPLGQMFPLRVLKVPKAKDGSLLPLQNVWFGLNGLIVHEIRGGINPDGSPVGIPGHSLPLGITMYHVTELKTPRDPGTNAKEGIIGLGNLDPHLGRGSYLPELLFRIGYKGNFRGVNNKTLSVIKRIEQYVKCTHRLIVYRTEQDALAAYLKFRADGFAPSPAELSQRDSTASIVADYNIWSEAELTRTGPEFRAYFRLTPEFMAGPAKKAVPIAREVISRLLRNAQDISLCILIARHVWMLHKAGKEFGKPIQIRSLQDQVGQNGAIEYRRPEATIAAIKRVGDAWNAAAEELGKPECKLRYTIDPGGGRAPATVKFYSAPSMTEFEMDE